MKRFLFILMFLSILLSLSTGTVFAGSVLDVKVSNGGGGPTFTFTVTGEFSPSELNGGFVQVEGGDSFQLNCVQIDDTTIVCHAPKKVSGNVVVGFGGARFWVDMPEPSLGGGGGNTVTDYCYNMYDLFYNPSLGKLFWNDTGDHCQPTTANPGDVIYSDYYFYLNEPTNLPPEFLESDPGQGYYYSS